MCTPGYQIHVRMHTILSVLQALSEVYSPPSDAPSILPNEDSSVANGDIQPVVPPFDLCVKGVVELVMDDLFGEAALAKEADGDVKSSQIKEAKGMKAFDCLEMLARWVAMHKSFLV